jgi:hypothetical protein
MIHFENKKGKEAFRDFFLKKKKKKKKKKKTQNNLQKGGY